MLVGFGAPLDTAKCPHGLSAREWLYKTQGRGERSSALVLGHALGVLVQKGGWQMSTGKDVQVGRQPGRLVDWWIARLVVDGG
jgi:hypothetical protein